MADPDVWWHVRTGRWVLEQHAVPHVDPWSFTAGGRLWVPTAWLGDVLLAGAWHLGGYDGVRVLRVLMAAAVAVALWLVARRFAATTSAAAWAAAGTLLCLAPFLRERPQVLGLLLVAWLAVLLQGVLDGRMPALLPTVGLTYLWANLHGTWVLAPVGLVGAGVLAWAADRSRVPLAARCTTAALLGLAAAALTPAGPRVAVWPLVVQRAAAPITEWHPTVPVSAIGLPFVVLLLVALIRQARSGSSAHLAFVVAVGAFGMLAFRDVAPAAILLLPELLRGTGAPAPAPVPARLVAAPVGMGVALALLHLATSPTSTGNPDRLVEELASRSGEVRVLNDYDVGGLITGTASPPARVAIDGRTDIWSPSYVRDYLNAIAGVGDWRPLVDRLRPDVALVRRDSEVARGLVAERGWRVTATEGPWALVEPAR